MKKIQWSESNGVSSSTGDIPLSRPYSFKVEGGKWTVNQLMMEALYLFKNNYLAVQKYTNISEICHAADIQPHWTKLGVHRKRSTDHEACRTYSVYIQGTCVLCIYMCVYLYICMYICVCMYVRVQSILKLPDVPLIINSLANSNLIFTKISKKIIISCKFLIFLSSLL